MLVSAIVSSTLCLCVQGPSSAVVPLQLDASGKVKYDVLARMGQRKEKVHCCDIHMYIYM